MITVKEWMELVDYRITEGSDYGWQCFGSDAYSLSSWNGNQDGWSFNIVFDRDTQEVYTVEVCDYARKRAYRIINPDHKQNHDLEAKEHNVSANEAWDECDFVDLDVDDDFIQKALAIKAGEDYDTRVSVPIELPDDVLFEMMKRAHDRDITFNQLVEEILWIAVREAKNESVDQDAEEDKWWDDLLDEDVVLEDDPPFPVKKKDKGSSKKSKKR